MTRRLSEADKELLKVKREREKEEARSAKRDQREREKAEIAFWKKPLTSTTNGGMQTSTLEKEMEKLDPDYWNKRYDENPYDDAFSSAGRTLTKEEYKNIPF